MTRKIIRNSVKCLLCKDHITSEHRHDFRSCSCGNIGVDGGNDYLRRVGSLTKYIDTSLYEE